MFNIIPIKDIIIISLLFIIFYLILYLDQQINSNCECNEEKKVSINIPLIMSIIIFSIYKYNEKDIKTYFVSVTTSKQMIITDMVDF